jgi:hypothetical protein
MTKARARIAAVIQSQTGRLIRSRRCRTVRGERKAWGRGHGGAMMASSPPRSHPIAPASTRLRRFHLQQPDERRLVLLPERDNVDHAEPSAGAEQNLLSGA